MIYCKKVVIIYYENKPCFLLDVKDLTSKEDYENLKKQCANNLKTLQQKQENEKIEYKKDINKKINDLATAIKTYQKGI